MNNTNPLVKYANKLIIVILLLAAYIFVYHTNLYTGLFATKLSNDDSSIVGFYKIFMPLSGTEIYHLSSYRKSFGFSKIKLYRKVYLPDLNIDKFVSLNSNYARDDKNVVYIDSTRGTAHILSGINPKTAIAFEDYYIKDDKSVFYKQFKLNNTNPNKYTLIETQKYSSYRHNNKILISNSKVYSGSEPLYVSLDKKFIIKNTRNNLECKERAPYKRNYSMCTNKDAGKISPKEDLIDDTFHIIEKKRGFGFMYAKDKNNIYYINTRNNNISIIPGVDVNSFVTKRNTKGYDAYDSKYLYKNGCRLYKVSHDVVSNGRNFSRYNLRREYKTSLCEYY